MKKFKNLYRIDFTTTEEATSLFKTLWINRLYTNTEAKEEVRKRYGFATVHMVAASWESANRRFENTFKEEIQAGRIYSMTIDPVIQGSIL
jgi:hypothetical protein